SACTAVWPPAARAAARFSRRCSCSVWMAGGGVSGPPACWPGWRGWSCCRGWSCRGWSCGRADQAAAPATQASGRISVMSLGRFIARLRSWVRNPETEMGRSALKFLYEDVGLGDRGLHLVDELGDFVGQAGDCAFERGDGPRVEIVLEEERLVGERLEHRLHRGFDALHGGEELIIAVAGAIELVFTGAAKLGALVLVELFLPFAEQRLGNPLDIIDAVADILRPRFAALLLALQAPVQRLHVA